MNPSLHLQSFAAGVVRASGRFSSDQYPFSEMIVVPDEARDGRYLLELQLPHFINDAAPSRPVEHDTPPSGPVEATSKFWSASALKGPRSRVIW